ncbi:MAG TPA: hypothetical protein VFQ26_07845 [Nitrospiraceae bacterium]|nr:hypothetical protein [Nitrospiraceae bacterium]
MFDNITTVLTSKPVLFVAAANSSAFFLASILINKNLGLFVIFVISVALQLVWILYLNHSFENFYANGYNSLSSPHEKKAQMKYYSPDDYNKVAVALAMSRRSFSTNKRRADLKRAIWDKHHYDQLEKNSIYYNIE